MDRATRLPLFMTLAIGVGLLLHGPIHQPGSYHDFADQRLAFGIRHAADVLSNAGFALIGLWGLYRLWPARHEPEIARGWPGYRLYLIALILTAAGSIWYHLAPDNARLVWDRLPIALACAGLLAAVRAETLPGIDAQRWVAALTLAAVFGVAWWYGTGQNGLGDLRPYLMLQGLPLLLIPLWQAEGRTLRADRRAFGLAILLYAAAKAAELFDHEIYATLHWISGHTIKHLLAAAASLVLTVRLVKRLDPLARPGRKASRLAGTARSRLRNHARLLSLRVPNAHH